MKKISRIAVTLLLLLQPLPAMAASLFNYQERPATANDAWYQKIDPLWQRVLQEEKETPGFRADGKYMVPGDALTWRNLLKAAGDMSKMELVRMINGYFNHWLPKADNATWGQEEYWTAPREFFAKRGGDCEDYAIAKYFALRYLKFDADSMRIVVVRVRDEKGEFKRDLHAVLAVYAKDTWFILDNNARPRDNIFPQTMYGGKMVPVYSTNEKGAWLHAPPEGKTKNPKPANGNGAKPRAQPGPSGPGSRE